MKLIDGDRLKKHLDYLIKKDTQFAKMCEGNDDFNRQRKYSFEANILAYELCQNVMDYYLVRDIQSMEWISVKDRLPETGKNVLVYYPKWKGNEIQVAHLMYNRTMFSIDGIRISVENITHWQPLPEPPKDGDTNGLS